MEKISVTEFKAVCLRLLREINTTGKSLLITRGKIPIAVISPPPAKKTKQRGFGCMKDRIRICGDIIAPIDGLSWSADPPSGNVQP